MSKEQQKDIEVVYRAVIKGKKITHKSISRKYDLCLISTYKS